MGQRGPKPRPDLSLVKGTGRKQKKTAPEPQPKPLAPRPPAGMTEPARRIWRQLAPKLERLNLLTEVDGFIFGLFCQALADGRRAKRILDKQGWTFRTKSGYLQARPEVAMYRSANADAVKIGARFGLTPADRVGLQVPVLPEGDAGEDEEMEKLLSEP